MDHSFSNQILRQLDQETFRQIEPNLRRVELKQGEVLGEPFSRIQSVYFRSQQWFRLSWNCRTGT